MRDPIYPDTTELRGPKQALAQLDGATSDLNAEALEGRAVGRHPVGREMALGVSTDAFGGLVPAFADGLPVLFEPNSHALIVVRHQRDESVDPRTGRPSLPTLKA